MHEYGEPDDLAREKDWGVNLKAYIVSGANKPSSDTSVDCTAQT